MISTPPSVVSAISAVASRPISSRFCTRRMLFAMFAVLAMLFFGAPDYASAQTAHFSGAQSLSTVGSGFNTPAGVAFDNSGNIYVADAMNNVVREILAVNGSIPASPTIITLGSGFKSPIALALDGSGNVYVADYGNSAVKEILAVNGSIPASPTIRTLTTVQLPSGIAVDGSGNVFVSVGCVISSLGMTSNVASASTGSCGPLEELLAVNGSIPASPVVMPFSGFTTPAGLAFDTNGNLYVADQGSNSVKEILAVNGSITASSTIKTVASFTGTTGPTGVAVDSSGNAYVAYPSNNAVYEVMAVNGSIPASPAIVSIGSGFKSPLGVAVDKSGTIYVADALNNRVVKMSLSIADFGAINIGTTSTAIPMLFTFDTAGTLGSMAVLTQGATGLDFANVGTGSCKANTAYAAGQSCTVNVAFTPRFAGTRNGTAVLYNIAGIAIAAGNVQGTGLGPQIDFYPGTTSTVTAISSPQGLAIDNSGNIFVANTSGIYEMLAVNGSVPASPSIRTITPTGGSYYSVALDASGNLYTVAYPGNSVIEIEAVNGTIPASPNVVTLASGFNNLQFVAVDHSGNVYVADSVNSAVKEILAVNGSIPSSPTIVTLATESGCTIGPLAVDGSGNVFFACGQSLMEIVAVNGSIPASPVIRTLANNGALHGITVDVNGSVYVSNVSNGEIEELLAVNGSVAASSYLLPLGQGFMEAEGLAVDANGNVYIADVSNNRVAKLNPSTPPSLTFAPTALGATSVDSPQLVAVTNVGNALLTFPIPSTGTNPSIGTNFTLGNSPTCPVLTPTSYQPDVLLPGASCLMPISFVPASTGSLSSSLTLTDNNLNAATPAYATQSITLSGTGLQPVPNFTLMASSPVTITQGTASTPRIQVVPGSGFTGSVSLAVNGLPSGVTAAFAPNPTTSTSTLTLAASNSATPGTTIVVINGTAGTQTVSTSLQLTVVALPPSFSLVANPSSLTVNQGGSGTSTITVAGRNGFSDSVNLAASGLPDGVTASFSPNPTTGTSVLTFAASNTAIAGQVYVTVTGTSGALTGANGIYLTIVPQPGFAPPSQNFGSVNIGTASTVQTLTYTFGASVTLGSASVLTQGAAGLDFTDAGTGTCAANTAYTVGQSCTVNVTFTPKYAGTRNGAVVLNDSNGNPIATAYLQGTGIGPQINFLPGTETTIASWSSGLSTPFAVAVDGSGNVYIADSANNVILKESPIPGGYTESTIPTSGLSNPAGVAVDGGGNVYIADVDNHRVLRETPVLGGYAESIVADLSNNDIVYPRAVAVDGSGNVYFISPDSQNEDHVYIARPSANGYIQSTIPFSGIGNLGGLAVDGSGNVFLIDIVNSQVIKEAPSAEGYTQSTVLTNGLIQPEAIAVDGMGNIYITDCCAGPVLKETPTSGTYIQSALSIDALNQPLGIAVDASGNLYIADAGNYLVLKENFADAPSLTFTSTAFGSTSTDSPQTITIENVGNAPLSFPVPASGSNPNISANFTLNSSGDAACPLVSSDSSTAPALAAGASCQLPISFTPTAAGVLSGTLVLTDNNLYSAAPGYATQTIYLTGTATQATPAITWAAPEAITYGAPLNGAQLNAASTVDGTFTYSPAAGTVLEAGQQTLTVTFTPTDSADYTTATASVTLTVNKAAPTITWATPAPITYRTPLSGVQFNAIASVDGNFNYLQTTGTILEAGQQTLTAIFTPLDTADYTTVTTSVTLIVNKATPVISWPTPAPITYGTPIGDSQLNTTVTVDGTFTYSPVSGTVLGAGLQTLTATFTPTDLTNYTPATASVTLTVNKATPTITWSAPAAITYGTALSGTQLNAKSTVPGTFTYSPAAGTVLNAGTQTLTATFTPADAANYTSKAASVNLTVNKAKLTISWATPSPINYGTALSGIQLNATSTASGAFTYSPAAGTVLGAGSHTLSVTFKPAIASNFTTASATATVTLAVNKSIPAITWSAPAAITYGTALSATQLNASTPVAGKFTYSPATGTVLTIGTHTLSATFTPADAADYNSTSVTVTLTVNKATPTVKLTSSASSIARGRSLTFTSSLSRSGVVPTGPVSFFDGATQLGTSTLNASGVATYSTNKLAVGKHNITASYGGDGNYIAATSAAISVTVSAY